MRNVLLIAYSFPPIGGIGALRAVKFAKYLPDFGWRPVILTVTDSPDFVHDQALLDSLPPDLPVYRANSWEPLNVARVKRAASHVEPTATGHGVRRRVRSSITDALKSLYFTLRAPDDKIGWLPFATRMGSEILRHEQIHAILATSPPYTDLLVGARLKGRQGPPLVLDYRDEWSTLQYRDLPSNAWIRGVNRRLETYALKRADAVVTATPRMEQNLADAVLLPDGLTPTTIMNGFDPADHADATRPRARNPRLTIVYTGSFYGKRRTPEFFLRGLERWLAATPAARAAVDVRFVGSIFARHTQIIQQLGLEDVVTCTGTVSHADAVREQVTADVLLLVVGKGSGSNVMVTGKIFEYMAARRPILATVPTDGPAAALVRDAAVGQVVDSEDIAAIAEALHTFFSQWQAGAIPYTPREEVVGRYDRRHLTGQLAAVLDRVCQDTKQPVGGSHQ